MDGSKRVLHVIDSLDLGGAQTFLYHALKHFPDPSYEFEVAALHGPGVYSEKFEEAGFKVHHLAASKFDPRLVLRLGRLIRSGTFDIVHAHLVISSFLCERLRSNKIETRIAIHIHNDMNWSLDSVSQKPLKRRLGRRADMALGCSRFAIDTLKTSSPKRVIHNGVDIEKFAPADARERLEARKAFGFSESDIVVGFTGRFAHQKNPVLLMKSFASALKRRPSLKLLLVGSGTLEEELRSLADELDVMKSVHFAGFRMNVAPALHAMDIFVFPSIYEGFGISLIEAMACALPCIASDYPAVHEIIENPKEGVISPNGDEAALSKVISQLADSPDRRAIMGETARLRACTAFDYALVGIRLKTIYRELIPTEELAS